MENIQEKARNYFFSGNSEKELQLARLGFVEGYKQSLEDSKAPVMLEMLKEIIYSDSDIEDVYTRAKQLIKEVTELK